MEKRTYNSERVGYDVEGPCFHCGSVIRYFVDEDGTPRDVTPVYDEYKEETDAAMNFGAGAKEERARIRAAVQVLREDDDLHYELSGVALARVDAAIGDD